MENKLMIFENEAFGKVRTLNLNGEPWFVAADVCKALELGNPSMTVERLDDDEKGMIGVPWLLAFALRADGWYLRSDIIWQKANPMPESTKDRPSRCYEHIFLLSKSRR